MSYESPIEVILGQMQTKYENGMLEAVQNCGFQIDHDELAKALMYDRNQYEKGYKDRDLEIIRCKDCKHFQIDGNFMFCNSEGSMFADVTENDYCSYAERRKEE